MSLTERGKSLIVMSQEWQIVKFPTSWCRLYSPYNRNCKEHVQWVCSAVLSAAALRLQPCVVRLQLCCLQLQLATVWLQKRAAEQAQWLAPQRTLVHGVHQLPRAMPLEEEARVATPILHSLFLRTTRDPHLPYLLLPKFSLLAPSTSDADGRGGEGADVVRWWRGEAMDGSTTARWWRSRQRPRRRWIRDGDDPEMTRPTRSGHRTTRTLVVRREREERWPPLRPRKARPDTQCTAAGTPPRRTISAWRNRWGGWRWRWGRATCRRGGQR